MQRRAGLLKRLGNDVDGLEPVVPTVVGERGIGPGLFQDINRFFQSGGAFFPRNAKPSKL